MKYENFDRAAELVKKIKDEKELLLELEASPRIHIHEQRGTWEIWINTGNDNTDAFQKEARAFIGSLIRITKDRIEYFKKELETL